MTVDQAKAGIEKHQRLFEETVKQPNTLERNLVLAEHRNEISRLRKFLARDPAPAAAPARKARKQVKAAVASDHSA